MAAPLTDATTARSLPMSTVADAIGLQVKVETMRGDTYQGCLDQSDAQTMNTHLSVVLLRKKDGSLECLDSVVIPGREVKFIVLPDQMKQAPVFADICKGRSPFAKKPMAAQRRQGKKGKYTNNAGKKRSAAEADNE